MNKGKFHLKEAISAGGKARDQALGVLSGSDRQSGMGRGTRHRVKRRDDGGDDDEGGVVVGCHVNRRSEKRSKGFCGIEIVGQGFPFDRN